MKLYQEITQSLRDRNYAKIPLAISRREYETAAERFFMFLQLPLEWKQSLHFFLDPDNVAEVGYFSKSSDDGRSDDKEFFHYHPAFRERFAEEIRRSPDLADFISAADGIYQKAEKLFREIAREFDNQFPGLYETLFPPQQPALLPLRFLKYHSREKGAFLAKGHYDRGVATLALAESAPGLRIGRSPEKLEDIVHEEKTAIFMPGLYFPNATSEEFMPAWHDVVQKQEDSLSGDTARWAIVMFSNSVDMGHPSFQQSHTPQGK